MLFVKKGQFPKGYTVERDNIDITLPSGSDFCLPYKCLEIDKKLYIEINYQGLIIFKTVTKNYRKFRTRGIISYELNDYKELIEAIKLDKIDTIHNNMVEQINKVFPLKMKLEINGFSSHYPYSRISSIMFTITDKGINYSIIGNRSGKSYKSGYNLSNLQEDIKNVKIKIKEKNFKIRSKKLANYKNVLGKTLLDLLHANKINCYIDKHFTFTIPAGLNNMEIDLSSLTLNYRKYIHKLDDPSNNILESIVKIAKTAKKLDKLISRDFR